MKKYTPNTVTLIRFIISLLLPFIIILNIKVGTIIFILLSMNKAIDKIWLRRTLTIPKYDQKIEQLSNNMAVILALLTSIFIVDKALFITWIFEITIIVTKVIYNSKSLAIFRFNNIKSIILRFLVVVGFITTFNDYFELLFYLLMVITSILQIIALMGYWLKPNKKK